MYPPPLWLMALLVPALYLATYGPGRLVCRVLGLKLGSAQERLGLGCATGAVLLGWVGYVAAMAGLPWLAIGGGWLALATGVAVVVWELTRGKETCDLENSHRVILVVAVLVGLGFTAAMNWGQLRYEPIEALSGRFLWPDLLYRNAVMARLMNCDGPPDWPWLAGVPMEGMSLLRFTALVPVMKALGVSSNHYQIAALWLGLFGVPVAACCCFAFGRALGAAPNVAAVATLLTAFLGNPRWLWNERFAHSPALHWAGTDVFAVSVPVFFALLALLMLAVRQRQKAALWLSLLFLVSGMGFIPWKGLSIYAALPLWFVLCLFTRQDRKLSLTLALGALAGVAVLKVLMGSGTAGGSLLGAIGPTTTIRNLGWGFPFLAEPLSPLLADLNLTNAMKLLKFAAVYPVATVFYVLASMWVRNVIFLAAHRFPWRRMRQPEYLLGLCLVIAGVLLSSVVDFNKLAYQGAQYDVLRVLWPALMLANVALAYLLVEKWPVLRRGWGIPLLLLFAFYGSWENVQVSLWSRTGLQPVTAPLAHLRYLDRHVQPQDVVLINPRIPPPLSSTLRVYAGDEWGYTSGLLNALVWLDNEEMARKFGQGPLWDERWRELDKAWRTKNPAELREFLQRNHIRWVINNGLEPLAVSPEAAGLKPAPGLELAPGEKAGIFENPLPVRQEAANGT